MNLDRKYLLFAFGYAIFGMGVGIAMGISGNHQEFVAHAHILLVGFVVSFIYSLVHKLWLGEPGRGVAMAQFYLHHTAAVAMFASLLLLYGGVVPPEKLEPVLGASSIGVLIAAVLMTYMIVASRPARA